VGEWGLAPAVISTRNPEFPKTETTFPTGSGTTSLLGGTVSHSATSGTQTVALLPYKNLRFEGGGTKRFPSGTTHISGDFTIGGTASGDSTTNSATVEFNDAGAQAVAAMNYYSLTFSNAGTKTIGAGTTAAGNFTTSGTVTASCGGALTVTGTVTIGSGTTFSGGSATIDFNGAAMLYAPHYIIEGPDQTRSSIINLDSVSPYPSASGSSPMTASHWATPARSHSPAAALSSLTTQNSSANFLPTKSGRAM
jgi:hypothetical protein